ncbi:unnamed protein product [Toxocara canis]|nr:unnamed protein product [Toxocara canis]
MANRGSDTNQSQFFITFRPCKYLDGKHTIFGRVVGGTDTLTAIERLETDATTDRPVVDVIFLTAEVFVDPFEEAEAAVQKEREEIRAAKAKKEAGETVSAPVSATLLPKPKVYGTGVGKYLNLKEFSSTTKRPTEMAAEMERPSEPQKKRKAVRSELNDFSSW